MYEVYLERRVEKFLRRLSAKDFYQVVYRIKNLAKNPRPPGCRKILGSKNDWRLRSGNYRIIYEIDDKKRVVRVMLIRHRREVYRKGR